MTDQHSVRRLVATVLLLVTASLGSCKTKLAIVDPHFGFERGHAGKSISLKARRAPVEWVEDGGISPATGALVYHLGDCRAGQAKRIGFTLSFLIENRSTQVWHVKRGMFDLHNESVHFDDAVSPIHEWSLEPVDTGTENEVMIAVSADTSTVLDVPIQVVCPNTLSENDALRSTFHLSISSDGHEYLHRQIDTGRWGPWEQLGRAVAVFTLALVAIAAL